MRDVAHESDDLADHEVGDGFGIAARGVDDGDAAPAGRAEVDVHRSAAHAGQQPKTRESCELLVAAGLRLEDPPDGASGSAIRERHAERRAAPIDDLVVELTREDLERRAGEIGRDEQRLHAAGPTAAAPSRAKTSA